MSPLASKLCLIFCWCSVLFHSTCRGAKDEKGFRGVGFIPTESPTAASCESIAEVLLGNIDTFSTLVEFASQADLVSALNDTKAEIYIAAPTNDAFAELEPEIVSNLMTDEWKTHLQSLILYHAVESGAFSAYNDDDDTSSVTLTTLNGEDITITYTDDRDVFINNDALVVDDFVACESLVDVIDKVLLPSWVENSIVDRAIADEELSILVNLVVQAELDEILSSSGPYTVLAPSNDAFRELLASPSVDPSNVDINLIKGLLTFHVLDGIYSADEIVDGLELATLQGDAVVFAVDGDVVTVNGSLVTDVDILANNGIIHKIDGVLIPNISIPTVETPDSSTIETTIEPVESPSVAAPSETEILGTIVDVASADENFSILVDAVVYTGLAETLSSAGPFTVFAPTNDVWTKALTNPDDITVLDADTLKEILLYHTVSGTYTAADITDGLTLTTVQGETIEFSIDGDVVMINDDVMITGTDILASNGVIHTIDGILFPQAALDPTEDPTEDEDEVEDPSDTPGTIVDVASADKDLSILVDAVVYAGLADTLSSAGPFTVFAPTNDVWTEGLINPDDITVLDADVLKQVLLYHTVAGIYTAADITDGLTLTTVQGETIEFSIDDDAVMINGNVMITGTDIDASNGVIHTIDNFLFPQATEPTEDEDEDEVEDPSETPGTIVDVASADEDLSILVDAVVYAGLAETLSSAGPFTVFAPTNDVWSKALANPDDITELDADTLKEILLYHTVAGIYTAADITDGLTLTTVQGETIEFSIDGDAVMINGNVMITGTDILASNGVIHTIDNILFPQATEPEDAPTVSSKEPTEAQNETPSEPTGTIIDVASGEDDLSILVNLIVQAGLVDTLSSAGPFTVFAPTNSAFITVFNDLGLDAADLGGVDNETLSSVLTYHVVAGIYKASDITDGLTLTTVQGDAIEFAISGDGVVTVNNEVISVTDIPASNGVIHTIAGVLFPGQS